MTQTMPHHIRMETGGSSELGRRSRILLKKLGEFALRPFRRMDKWVSARVEASPRGGETGWYLHTGEGRAIAAGAKVTEGMDVSSALSGPEFALAIEAVREAKPPEGGDYGALLDATFEKYHELRNLAEADAQSSPAESNPQA